MALALYNFCNPYIDVSKERDIILDGKVIKISQDKTSGIGLTLWDCVKLFLI
jgi:hypothetical protein